MFACKVNIPKINTCKGLFKFKKKAFYSLDYAILHGGEKTNADHLYISGQATCLWWKQQVEN